MPIGRGFEEVLAGAKDGDHAAFEVLYRDLAPLVLGYLRGRRAPDPEDLTSETFVAVVRNLSSFQGDEIRFRSWVLTIAHRRLLDSRRRAKRRPESLVDPDEMPELKSAGTADAAAGALERMGAEDVLALLDELTDDQRAVVLLRMVSDLPVDEVARILKKRPGAVKTLQRRAFARLAQILANTPQTDETTPRSGEPFPDEVAGR